MPLMDQRLTTSDQLKRCTKCQNERPLDMFNRQKKGKYGVTSVCRPCINALARQNVPRKTSRRWGNTEQSKISKKARKKRLEKRKQNIILAAKNKPCMDCGQQFPPCAMDFDHQEIKLFHVSGGHKRSFDDLRAEIAKCDVVCANCHRIRTHIF